MPKKGRREWSTGALGKSRGLGVWGAHSPNKVSVKLQANVIQAGLYLQPCKAKRCSLIVVGRAISASSGKPVLLHWLCMAVLALVLGSFKALLEVTLVTFKARMRRDAVHD